MDVLAGIHPVREALRAGRSLDRVLVSRGSPGVRIQEIVELCRSRHVPLRFETREVLDRAAPGAVHHGVVAFTAAQHAGKLEDLAADAELVVVLDGIEDPRNLGAVVRTSHAAGASAVVIPERRTAPLTETVAKAAAGALAWMPVLRVANVAQAIEKLRQQRFWIYALDQNGEVPYHEVDYNRPTALVFGSEGRGIHHNVRRRCDATVRIPMAGPISSLNVSVAAGVVLFEWRRRAGFGRA